MRLNKSTSKNFTDYTKIIEAYYDFAYYTCCVPYHFRKAKCGRYILHTWWPQRIASYLMSAIYVYIILHRFIERFSVLLNEKENHKNNPWLYLRFLEAASYVNYAVTTFYIQSFKGKQFLKFWNKVQAYSEKYHPLPCHISNRRKFLCSSYFVNCVAGAVTIISVSNFFIYNRDLGLDCEIILEDARNVFLWSYRSLNQTVTWSGMDDYCPNATVFDSALIASRLIVEEIRNMRDLYNEFSFIVGIVSIWIISLDFKSIVAEELSLTKLGRSAELLSFKLYHEVCHLSRSFNHAHGLAMLSYFLSNITYYPISLDKLVLPVHWGTKLYCWEYILTAATIYGLGAHFSHQMTCLQSLMDLQNISSIISKSKFAVVMHLNTNHFHTFRSKIFPITFHTTTEFLKQVMVILLISVESKLGQTNQRHISISEYGT